ncbi:MAG: IS481 family transposase [Planctomycetota bacterium]|jgi:transposase InsO family protein
MTAQHKIARRKLSLLELAEELGNVSKACEIIGYSRQQFYEIRRNFQTYGAQGLIDRLPGAKGPHPNRVPEDVEKAILDYALEQPTHGPVRVAQQLALRDVHVSSGGVRGVWQRHDLLTKHQRLLRLERHVRQQEIELTDTQVQLLERFDPEFRERHIEVKETGELLGVDTFHVGTIKGVGRVYAQTAIDCHSRYVFARLYTTKMPVTSVHLLNNDVLPFFERHDTPLRTVLSDNGREFCGRPDHHPYELFLQLEGIAHRTTRVRRPQSNGYLERFHRTLLDEHLRIKGRTKWYESVEEMQKDLDIYLHHYNHERTHQGRNMNGRTPIQVFEAGKPKPKNKPKERRKTKAESSRT